MTEPIPFWEDWRLWSVTAAFLGFTFGTWIKHAFDLRLDRIRRDQENRVFAIAFRAELGALVSDAMIRLHTVKTFSEARKDIATDSTAQFNLSAKLVYANNTHRLGGLGGRVAFSLVEAHRSADHIRHNVGAVLVRRLDRNIEKPALEVFRKDFRRLIEDAAQAINALDAFLGDRERYPDPKALAAELDPGGDLEASTK